MSIAKQAITVPAVSVELLEGMVAVIFSEFEPTDEKPKRGDTLLDGPELTETLDHTFASANTDVDTFAALFQRATALWNYCGTTKVPKNLIENGYPGRVLCKAAATAPLVQIPGATPEIAAWDFDREAMRAAIAAARN